MKCLACGKDNVQDARFCAYCGAGMPVTPPPSEETPQSESITPEAPAARQTARPLSDNPYQPHRAPYIPSANPIEKKPVSEPEPAPKAESFTETAASKPLIPPSPKRVFLFEEELEEQRKAAAAEKKKARLTRKKASEIEYEEDEETDENFGELDDADDFDEFDEFEYDDSDDDEDPYEDDGPSAGRIFVRIFSVLTVLILIAGVIAFMYGTTVGRRLRASMGMSSKAEDYLLLADWQLEQNTLSAASDSYYTAFKLAQDDYDLALAAGQGFEDCGDDMRAEQMYTYLISTFPQRDEAYDRLMAMLNQQGRIEQFDALMIYREEHQPGYVAPKPDTPTSSHQSGAYAGSLQLTLSAGSAEIRYTLDGTQPTENSLLYTGPIMLTKGTYNVRAIALRNGETSGEWAGSFVIT